MKRWLAPLAAVGLFAAPSMGQVYYDDPSGDLFDNGFTNLDITQCKAWNDSEFLCISVDTVGFQNWTKYLFFFDTGSAGTTTNGWGRPIDIGAANPSGISHFAGSWVDQPNSNTQLWSWDGAAWGLGSTIDNDQGETGSNRVTWMFSLAWLGVGVGDTIRFDVATSGGGNDPGVDHLSRSDMATPGWGDPSVAGAFLSYTIVPTPGALALLAVAGIARSRRRG